MYLFKVDLFQPFFVKVHKCTCMVTVLFILNLLSYFTSRRRKNGKLVQEDKIRLRKCQQSSWQVLPFINNLKVPPLQEAAHLWFAGKHNLHQFPHHLLLVSLSCGCVPFLQPQLSLPAEQQHETHLNTTYTQKHRKQGNVPNYCCQQWRKSDLIKECRLLCKTSRKKDICFFKEVWKMSNNRQRFSLI